MLSKRALLPSVAGSHQARPISLKETDGLQYARNPDLVWLSAASAVPDGALIPQPILFPSPATGAAFAASGLAACHPRAGTGEDQLRHAAHRRPPCWQPSPAEAEAFHDGVREHAGSRPPVIHASQVVADDSRSTPPKRHWVNTHHPLAGIGARLDPGRVTSRRHADGFGSRLDGRRPGIGIHSFDF